MRKKKMAGIVLAILLLVSFVCVFAADLIQRDHGNIDVSMGVLETDVGDLSYKL